MLIIGNVLSFFIIYFVVDYLLRKKNTNKIESLEIDIVKAKSFLNSNGSFFGMFGGGEKGLKKQLKDIYKKYSYKQ